jgi:hypothetical protein
VFEVANAIYTSAPNPTSNDGAVCGKPQCATHLFTLRCARCGVLGRHPTPRALACPGSKAPVSHVFLRFTKWREAGALRVLTEGERQCRAPAGGGGWCGCAAVGWMGSGGLSWQGSMDAGFGYAGYAVPGKGRGGEMATVIRYAARGAHAWGWIAGGVALGLAGGERPHAAALHDCMMPLDQYPCP